MSDNQTIKDRLILFIGSLNIGQGKFEKECGFSNGYINNISKNIGADKLQKILSRYPLLNQNWLLTGEGEMLRGGSTVVANNSGITAVNNTGRITASQDGSADNALANYAGMIEEIHNILLNEIATTRKELNAERDNFDNILSQQRAELMAIISKQNEHISALIGKLLDEK